MKTIMDLKYKDWLKISSLSTPQSQRTANDETK